MKLTVIKGIAVLLVLAAFAIHSRGQSMPGTVGFVNTPLTALTNFAGTPFPPAGSTTYAVGLYWGTVGTSESSLDCFPPAAMASHAPGIGMGNSSAAWPVFQSALTNSAGMPYPPLGSSTYSVGLYWGALGTSESSLQPLPAARNGVTHNWYGDGRFNGGIARACCKSSADFQVCRIAGFLTCEILRQTERGRFGNRRYSRFGNLRYDYCNRL
jgi:hypothetical protein